MRVSQGDSREDRRFRNVIKEHQSLKLQRKEKKGYCESSPIQILIQKPKASIEMCICDAENVEVQLFIGILRFCLNISSYVQISTSKTNRRKTKRRNIFCRA